MSRFFDQLPQEEAALNPVQAAAEPVSATDSAATGAEQELLSIEGVVGVGSHGGNVVVYARDRTVGDRLPSQVDGSPVLLRVTGEVVALAED